ncbi:MAG: hypothetical protein ACI4TM_02835 [Candidatus Cryptobacteroides sp.]
MKNFHLIISILLFVACGQTAQVTSSRDTTTEVRIERVLETDTVFVQLPEISEKVMTDDTVSVLENQYSKSSAEISSGVLTHSLQTKPVTLPVEVKTETVYKDSLVYIDRIIREDIYIEKPLTTWQTAKMKIGGYAIALASILIVCAILYFVSHSKLKFL